MIEVSTKVAEDSHIVAEDSAKVAEDSQIMVEDSTKVAELTNKPSTLSTKLIL